MKAKAMKAAGATVAAGAAVWSPPFAGRRPSRPGNAAPVVAPKAPDEWAEMEREWDAKWDDRLGDSRPTLRLLAPRRETRE